MSDLFEKLNWKILVLILFGVFGLILFTGNILNRSFESEIPKESPTPSPTKSVPKETNIFPPNSSFSTWKLYKTAQYELTYPSDWKMEKVRFATGGESTTFKPSNISKNDYYPSFNIALEVASKSSTMNQRKNILSSLNLKENILTFDNYQAIQYSGILPRKVSGKEVYAKVYILEKEGYIYTLKSQYFSSETINEATLERILSSFKFI